MVERLLPGGPFVIETAGAQRMLPGGPFLFETSATIFHPGSDITVAGWTPSTGTDLFACIDEPTTYNDADYITSPDLTTSTTMGWDNPVPAGTWEMKLRGEFFTGTSGQVRIVLLDAGSSSVGTSSWQALSGGFAMYTLSITTTGVSTQFRFEVQP